MSMYQKWKLKVLHIYAVITQVQCIVSLNKTCKKTALLYIHIQNMSLDATQHWKFESFSLLWCPKENSKKMKKKKKTKNKWRR